jgi:hypothetical protein
VLPSKKTQQIFILKNLMIQSGVMGEKRTKPKASISVFLEGPHDLQIACLLWVKDCALEGYLQIH